MFGIGLTIFSYGISVAIGWNVLSFIWSKKVFEEVSKKVFEIRKEL